MSSILLLNLDGTINRVFQNLYQCSKHFNCHQIYSNVTLNTGSIFMRNYRLVTLEFYITHKHVVLSWDSKTRGQKALEAKALKKETIRKRRLVIHIDDNGDVKEYKNFYELAKAVELTPERVRQVLLNGSNKHKFFFKHPELLKKHNIEAVTS